MPPGQNRARELGYSSFVVSEQGIQWKISLLPLSVSTSSPLQYQEPVTVSVAAFCILWFPYWSYKRCLDVWTVLLPS